MGTNGNVFVIIAILVLLLYVVESAKNSYYMDQQIDCGNIDVQNVNRDQVVNIYGRSADVASNQGSCSIHFRALDADAKLQIEFVTYSIKSCDVSLYLAGTNTGAGGTKSYSCADNPSAFFGTGRTVTVTLHKKDPNTFNFNFHLRLKAVREWEHQGETDASPIAVGLIIGIVGGVFGLIFIVACVGVCCFRKYRVRGSAGRSPYLYDKNNSKVPLDESASHVSVGYTNDGIRSGSPASKKKLLAHSSDSSGNSSEHNSQHNSRPYTLNLHKSNNKSTPPAAPPPPALSSSEMSPKSGNQLIDDRNGRDRYENVFKFDNADKRKVTNEKAVDVDSKQKNPILNALNSSSKFRNNMSANNRDAEERAKRISSTSSLEGLGPAPTPPSSQDDLSRPPRLPPVPKAKASPKSKHAVIKRAPRPTSVSSDELAQIEKGRAAGSNGGRRFRDDSSSSQSDVLSLTLADTKKKIDTTHSLKPDRKGHKGRKKQSQSVSNALETDSDSRLPPEPMNREVRSTPRTPKDRILNEEFEKTGSGRYSKRSNRSTPRSSGGRAGKGFSHRRGRSADHLDSRPTTPTSYYGSVESLPPLVRSSSKTSLYASRTSLYDRRGKRRQGSYSESIASTRDDMEVMRHSSGYHYYSDEDDYDGYERPLSRRDRDRIYKSETDIGRHLKETSTQTLRETATQTGPNETVDVKSKIILKKKKRSRSTSSSGTQTKKHKNGKSKARGSDSDSELKTKMKNTESDTEVKTKGKKSDTDTKKSKGLRHVSSDSEIKRKRTKRSKSVDEIEIKEEKPKPKPKPRKSTSADTHLDDNVHRSASVGNLVGVNQNYSVPQSEGFVPQTMYPGQYYPQPGYPIPPPPGYPGYPSQGQRMPFPPAPAVQPVASNGRKKSNWEMLCELTENGGPRDDVTETGSVASSVFTNNPNSIPDYGIQHANQGFYPPSGFQQYGYQQPQQPNYRPVPVPAGYQGGAPGMQPGVPQNKTLNKQSSWDALKEVTNPPNQQAAKQNVMTGNESIV